MGINSGRNQEIADNDGSTVAYSGTATTTVSNVPSTPGNVISGISLWNGLTEVEVSFDGGTTYIPIGRRAFFSHNVKGQITQFKIKTASGTSDWDALINFEEQ